MEIPSVTLRCGRHMPRLGFGTWRMGESPRTADAEVAALRHALACGFTHLDTAEMYGEGGAETLVGRAIAGEDRSRLFLTSKFYPHHAAADQVVAACERSLARLGTDSLDLYLLHWPGSTPFEETLEGVERLLSAGKIASFGISNFDANEVASLFDSGLGDRIDCNQVLYNPARRGIEFDLLPLLERLGVACVAYTPIEPRRLAANAGFARIAADCGLAPATLALAWHMTRGRACPIPKAATLDHIDALADAAGIRLPEDVMAAIDDAFPPPDGPRRLEIL